MVKVELGASFDAVQLQTAKTRSHLRYGMKEGFQIVGARLVRRASQNMLSPKAGQIYWVRLRSDGEYDISTTYFPGARRHRASARGETAANLSGRMRRSLGYRVSGSDTMRFGASARNNAGDPYPLTLERQLMRPTLAQASQEEQGSTLVTLGKTTHKALVRG